MTDRQLIKMMLLDMLEEKTTENVNEINDLLREGYGVTLQADYATSRLIKQAMTRFRDFGLSYNLVMHLAEEYGKELPKEPEKFLTERYYANLLHPGCIVTDLEQKDYYGLYLGDYYYLSWDKNTDKPWELKKLDVKKKDFISWINPILK